MKKILTILVMVFSLCGCAGQQIDWSKVVSVGEQVGNTVLRAALAYYSVSGKGMSDSDKMQWEAYLAAFTAAAQTGQSTTPYEQRFERFKAGY